ncbi:hypothetical protein RHMOL_Rhmol13G0051900 [Rhododendron molle]|uniref:Uncharacterized protein n=1 Tax=Rhododendron molle TaxID=49168 RepID=A0ACC0L3R2_RHOML|nr:hypothetical protein RHMOL_Rhmol13G0051900 [Rhododendron molle]
MPGCRGGLEVLTTSCGKQQSRVSLTSDLKSIPGLKATQFHSVLTSQRMGEIPSLFTLCLNAVRNEILRGDDVPRDVYELPSDLLDSLLTCLPPLALHKLQEQMPFENWDDGKSADGCFRNQRKRKRYSNFDSLWRTFYKSRWPGCVSKKPPVNWLEGQNADGHKSTNDWQQIYWEAHLQNCLDEAAEIALLPSFDGCIGEVRIPDAVLTPIGYEGHMNCSRPDYAKLSYHCLHFGYFARYLRLQNVLWVAETCNLLRTSKLQCLELWWIKSQEHNLNGVSLVVTVGGNGDLGGGGYRPSSRSLSLCGRNRRGWGGVCLCVCHEIGEKVGRILGYYNGGGEECWAGKDGRRGGGLADFGAKKER